MMVQKKLISRVVVCDANPFLSDSLCRYLGQTEEFVAVACDGGQDALVGLACEIKASAIIVDPAQMQRRPRDLIEALLKKSSACSVVAYYSPEASTAARECVENGFSGAISKVSSVSSLLDAIRTVCLGGIYLERELGLSRRPCRCARTKVGASSNLSEREQFVLEHVARGHSNKEIAGRLQLSIKTVETYKSRASRKLGLTHKAAIVDYALQNEWLR